MAELTKNFIDKTGLSQLLMKLKKEIKKADIFEIVPKQEYTDDDLGYDNNDTRAAKEYIDTTSRPEMKENIGLFLIT